MTEEQKTAHLTNMANRFWQEAEAPDGNAWNELFTCLATRNIPRMEALLKEYKVDRDLSEIDE